MTALLRRLLPDKNLEKRVLLAQRGEHLTRNQLIEEYKPFIQKTLSKQLGRYVEEQNDEAVSLGLIAFNDAIDRYEARRGPFLPFAATVIRNRIIDHIRKNNHQKETLPVSSLVSEEVTEEEIWGRRTWQPDLEEQAIMAEEMKKFIQRLTHFGITLDDLVAEAPKHRDTRRKAVAAAYWLYNQPDLLNKTLESGRMPLKEIEKYTGLTKKAVDRSRKLIIAVVVVLDSDLDVMKQYVNDMVKEGSE